jgi:hypothetical protein
MYPRHDGLCFNVYVESHADWHFNSRLYSSRVIGAKLAHNIISRAICSRFVFYVMVSSHKRLDDLITLLLLTKTMVYIVVFSLVMSPSDSSAFTEFDQTIFLPSSFILP